MTSTALTASGTIASAQGLGRTFAAPSAPMAKQARGYSSADGYLAPSGQAWARKLTPDQVRANAKSSLERLYGPVLVLLDRESKAALADVYFEKALRKSGSIYWLTTFHSNGHTKARIVDDAENLSGLHAGGHRCPGEDR
jgi:hypothetical protein